MPVCSAVVYFRQNALLLLVLFLGSAASLYSQQGASLQLTELNDLLQQVRIGRPNARSNAQLQSRSYLFEEQPLLAPRLSSRKPDLRTFQVRDRHSSEIMGVMVSNAGHVLIYLHDGPQSWVLRAPAGQLFRAEPERQTGSGPVCQMEHPGGLETISQGRSTSTDDTAVSDELFSYGTELRTYRLAIVATYEYFAFFPDYASAELELIASVLDLSQSYRREFAINFELIGYHIHTSADDGIDAGGDLLQEAQQAVTAQFDVADFDIGHVFHQEASGGFANGQVVCNDNWKARAWTANVDASVANVWWRQTLLHEFGHQFGASHTMDGTTGNCAAGRYGPAAYEPLSGSTTMSYYGGCGNQNVSPPPTNGFHVHTRQEVFNFTHFGGGNACPTITDPGNTPPVVDAQPLGLALATIPTNTPFRLTGSGYDPDGEQVFFSWEQYDKTTTLLPTSATMPNADDPMAPLFRSYFAQPEPVRVFPRMESVLSNSWPNVDEALPNVGRTMTFRLTGRDRNGYSGGVAVDELQVQVDGNSGPFLVLSPNGGESLTAGAGSTITWDPAGTDSYLSIVDIWLSTDGGAGFSHLLAEYVPNSGSLNLVLPGNLPATTQARLMVASGETSSVQFFDVSDGDLSIISNCSIGNLGQIGGPAITVADNQEPSVDPGLSYLGYPATAYIFDIPDNGTAPRAPMVGYNLDRTACEIRLEEDYEDIFLQVDQAGDYTVQFLNEDVCHGYITLFDEELFAENNPCAAFLASNGFGGFWYCDFTVNLQPGKVYRLRAYDVLGSLGEVRFISREGGHVYQLDPAQQQEPDWVALDAENGTIAAYSTDGSFTNLPPGSYQLYGIHFAVPVSLPAIAGKSLLELQQEGLCLEWSDNFKLLEIKDAYGSCLSDTIHIANFGLVPTDTIIARQLITAQAASPGGSILLQAGEKIILQPGFSAGPEFIARIRACEAPDPEVVSNVLQFDGQDDEAASLGSTALYATDFTIETWVKMTELTPGNADFFLEIGDGAPDKWLWFTGVDANGLGYIITGFRNGGTFQDFSFPYAPKKDKWFHLAAAYDNTNGEMSLYIDGILQGTQPASITPGNAGMPRLLMGRQISGGVSGHFLAGALEELRFWGACRSRHQIRQFMHQELIGDEAGLLAYYTFNAAPTACIDVLECSSNGLHAVRKGAAGLTNLPQYTAVAGLLQELSNSCDSSTDPCNNSRLPADAPGVEQALALNAILLYPNPARHSIQLEYHLAKTEALRIAVYNLSGQWLRDLVNELKPAGLYQEQFTDIFLPPGVYLVRFESSEVNEVIRMVIQ